MIIRDAIQECLQHLANTKAANTVRTYSDGFDVFAEYLNGTADSTIDHLTAQHFIDYPSWLMKRYSNKRTASLRDAAASYLILWFTLKGYIDWTVQDEAKYKRSKRDAFSLRSKPKPKVVPETDIQKAIDFVSQMHTLYPLERLRNVAIIHLLTSSGIRVSEVAALKVSDINLEGNLIFVGQAKEDKNFHSPISGKASEALAKYWFERGWYEPDDPAFARHDKQISDGHAPISAQGIQFMMRKLRKQAGITSQLTAHKFRHDRATKITKRYGVGAASKYLHHASINTTQVYVDLGDEDNMELAKEMFGD